MVVQQQFHTLLQIIVSLQKKTYPPPILPCHCLELGTNQQLPFKVSRTWGQVVSAFNPCIGESGKPISGVQD